MQAPPTERTLCVVLDLFGVLVAFDDSLVYDRLAQRCTSPQDAFRGMQNLVSSPYLIRGKEQLEDLHACLKRDLGLSASLDEFFQLWREPYSEPMPGIRSLLRSLAGQCELVLLSNIDRYYWPVARASLPELEAFRAVQLSFEQGVAKPEPEAFRRAVVASGVPVDACLFVDDKAENIEAAASLGLAGHVFRSTQDLQATLRARGLHVE
ncbi:HAD-IA family hydrolase [Rhizobacter sp. AJA081-3]|uniref:HAD family hydrolase n=1 Tax=Rhizobacter sp. AJA081-3 TaxID=2753607 RepID=UPI001AE05227|nr:HAD-IA family hydrolase [Rhizobacter sp. AJA081-3]QTN21521.1 HAD-IA family hydrolase [Rhizobacter sp. AJA081-3]